MPSTIFRLVASFCVARCRSIALSAVRGAVTERSPMSGFEGALLSAINYRDGRDNISAPSRWCRIQLLQSAFPFAPGCK